jgi:hypothetical protein
MQGGMLKTHCDRNIGPLYHAFTLYSNSSTRFFGTHFG